MFFYSFDLILIAAAVIPALILLVYIYRHDRLEPEFPKLRRTLVLMGILSTFFAIVCETVGSAVLDQMYLSDTQYNLLMYFIVVACSEEGGKYILLNKKTWKNPEFNCQFDAVVYATFVSLGFALWENISYVFSYGMGTAVIRAVTAVPGHACFGVFMGAFYGIAKRYQKLGNQSASAFYRIMAFVGPVLLHGTYDYIATDGSEAATVMFFGFVAIMFFTSWRLVKKLAASDSFI